MPFFSVIIPTFNRFEFVQKAIDSVLSQSFQDFELLLIDDGSTDQTPSLEKKYQGQLKYFRQPNLGVSAARNKGIKESQARHLAFLDSDDLWHPLKLEKQQKFQQKHDFKIHQTDEIWIRNHKRVNPREKHLKEEGDIFLASLNLCLISPSAVVIDKNLFEKHGLFDEKLPACEDYDLWLRITSQEKVGFLQEKLITKNGGHQDQLSKFFWGMDRFRVYSIIKLLNFYGDKLKDSYKKASLKIVREKLNILREGALKREKKEFSQKIDNLITMIANENYNHKDARFLLK